MNKGQRVTGTLLNIREKHITEKYRAVKHSIEWCSKVKRSAIQSRTQHRSKLQYNTGQCNTYL